MLTDDERRTLEVLEAVHTGDTSHVMAMLMPVWRRKLVKTTPMSYWVLTPAGRAELNRLRAKAKDVNANG